MLGRILMATVLFLPKNWRLTKRHRLLSLKPRCLQVLEKPRINWRQKPRFLMRETKELIQQTPTTTLPQW
tara:strand:- start:48 stop:257 length:210 start_codon:yes stop_codon:yes gene_type:complete